MKKKIFYATIFTLTTLLISCNSENSENPQNLTESFSDDPNPSYLKVFKSDVPTSSNYTEGFYEYNNGLLTSGTGVCWFKGTFQYDSNGKLEIKQKNGESFSYLYDNQNRLIKQSKIGTNDFISLSYNSNIITVTSSYSNSSSTPIVEVSEIYIDSLGRIIKTKRLTQTFMTGHLVQEYLYDARNNIVKKTYKESNANPPQQDYFVNYQYDDKKNPFYYSYKKLYKSIYYLESRNGIAIGIQTGVTPNNLIAEGNSTTFSYTYNNNGYPIKILQTYENGGPVLATLERTIEY